MIVLLALFAFWFAELSSVVQNIYIKLSEKEIKLNFFISLFFTVLTCTKCLSFQIGLIYFGYETRHIGFTLLYAGITSLTGMAISRIYYKLLS